MCQIISPPPLTYKNIALTLKLVTKYPSPPPPHTDTNYSAIHSKHMGI